MGKIFRDGTHPLWAAFAAIYLVAAIGHWYPKLTAMLVLVGLIVPILPLRLALERITGRKLTGQ